MRDVAMRTLAFITLVAFSVVNSESSWSYSGESESMINILHAIILKSLIGLNILPLEFLEKMLYYPPTPAGPDKWSIHYPTCGGHRQSPVDISNAVQDSSLKKVTYKSYTDKNFSVKNNGHSVSFDLTSKVARISGGGLSSEYTLVGFHLHWGLSNKDGSEHTLSGKQFATEIHFVHYDSSRFESLAKALEDPKGVAVLGVFVEEGAANAEFEKCIPSLSKVNQSGSSTELKQMVKLSGFFPSSDTFYRYDGSLTTPPCSESVVWTVFKQPITFSSAQFKALRALNSEHGPIAPNWRPVQPLNSRKIRAFVDDYILSVDIL